MAEIFAFEFMRNAFIAGLIVALLSGLVGSLVVVNRMVFLSGGIAHASYGGIGLALYFGIPVFYGALGFALVCAFLIARITYRNKERLDTFIGLLWAAGMAVGTVAIDLTPGYHPDMMSYLFGSILAVSRSDLLLMGIVAFLVATIIIFRYRDLLTVSYDSEFARLRGINVKRYYTLLLTTAALAIVVSIKVVGLILIIALLTVPVYIAEKLTGSLWSMMWVSTFIAMLFIVSGLIVSYRFDISSGATIILVSTVGMALFRLLMLFVCNKTLS